VAAASTVTKALPREQQFTIENIAIRWPPPFHNHTGPRITGEQVQSHFWKLSLYTQLWDFRLQHDDTGLKLTGVLWHRRTETDRRKALLSLTLVHLIPLCLGVGSGYMVSRGLAQAVGGGWGTLVKGVVRIFSGWVSSWYGDTEAHYASPVYTWYLVHRRS
jgi:hypothetical protein